MKAVSLALAGALLSATALASASFAQTSSGAPQSPAEASPSTASPDAAARTGTPDQRDWRDQMGRNGGWSRDRDAYDARDRRDMRQSSVDDDDDDMPAARSGGAQPSGHGDEARGRDGRGMHKMDPAMMRMHMRMMGPQEHGAHLKLKRGDSAMDIHCPGSENINACVEAVGKLMDRLQAMPQTPR